jgi:hypothetical protein
MDALIEKAYLKSWRKYAGKDEDDISEEDTKDLKYIDDPDKVFDFGRKRRSRRPRRPKRRHSKSRSRKRLSLKR